MQIFFSDYLGGVLFLTNSNCIVIVFVGKILKCMRDVLQVSKMPEIFHISFKDTENLEEIETICVLSVN